MLYSVSLFLHVFWTFLPFCAYNYAYASIIYYAYDMKKCTKLLLFCDICKYFAIKIFIRVIIVENVTFVWQK